jgi:hypothetical protein
MISECVRAVIGWKLYAKVLNARLYVRKVIKKELVIHDEDIDLIQSEKYLFEMTSNHSFLPEALSSRLQHQFPEEGQELSGR